MDTGAPKGVTPLLVRFLQVCEDPFLLALSQAEFYLTVMCKFAHDKFLSSRDAYWAGRADAYTDMLEYIAESREARTR